ncbi:MAG: 2-phosphosulfolactate phosphatase [Pirellulaceae bacterium]|nr:2-phosphosulfolactate phosphatase [Pirellulaceae bacterium]
MRLSVSLLPDSTRIDELADVAVVIDVLRATSVMTTALANGAQQLITCQEIQQAHQIASQLDTSPMLCGERQCKPIDGFDLGNSPAQYDRSVVANRTLVLTTTNGTRAIAAATAAKRLIAASFLNLSAVVAQLQQADWVHLICAGTDGEVTAEDVLLAGGIIGQLRRGQSSPDQQAVNQQAVNLCGDEAILAYELWRSWFADQIPNSASLSARLAETRGGKNLIHVGYQADLDRCAAIDTVSVVPERIASSPATFALPAIR